MGRGSSCGEARVRGEPEETELLSETIEGVSENAGEVKGVSMGRLMAGRV